MRIADVPSLTMRAHLASVALLGVVATALFSSVALADDAPSTTPRVRPPTTELRHVDAETLNVSPTPRPDTRAKEVVVLVGGYQSCSCIEDNTFDVLRDRLVASGYDVVRFGQDPRFPYDTFGHIDPSARNLRDEVRDLGKLYGGVHIVTHSMGGVVADQAFANGLSASDGVLTYVSWSAPHSGSDAARAIGAVRAVRGDGGLMRDFLLQLGMEPDSDATRDLAFVRAVQPAAGVVRLDLRASNDALVTAHDAVDPGVPSRVIQPNVPGLRGFDGHGAILLDSYAIDTTVATIATHRVPPDTRSQSVIDAARVQSNQFEAVVAITLCVLTIGLVTRMLDRSALISFASLALRFLRPRSRRRCA